MITLTYRTQPDYPVTIVQGHEPEPRALEPAFIPLGSWRRSYRISRSYLPPRSPDGRWVTYPSTIHLLLHPTTGAGRVVLEEGVGQGDPTSRIKVSWTASMTPDAAAETPAWWWQMARLVASWIETFPPTYEQVNGAGDAGLLAVCRAELPRLQEMLEDAGQTGVEVG